MQNASNEFRRLSVSDVRPIRADIFIDFYKNYVSGLPGLQDWDKYSYRNFSHRLINVEWVREVDEYSSVSMAMADFVLDNHDGMFTPNGLVKVAGVYGSTVLDDTIGYGSGNSDGIDGLSAGYTTRHAQSFIGIQGVLETVKWLVGKGGSPTGSVYAKIYAHSGTYGTSSVPTGSALATSDAIDVATLSGTALVSFTFSGANRITFDVTTKYAVSIEYIGGSGANYLSTGHDTSSPSHSGNSSSWNGAAWVAEVSKDRVFGVVVSNIVQEYVENPLGDYILPNRPVKIYSGFGSEVIQSFVGLTDGMPVINEKERTVTFHAVDFMSILMKKPLDQTSMYIGKRTDEVIRDLLNNEGLLDAQISLDLGLNLIPFAYMEKGEILGDVIFKLMEAEGGRLFMDESGMITFKNRNNYDNTVRVQLSPSVNIKSTVPTTSQELINVVVVKGKIREVQPNQPYGELTTPVQVEAGASVDIWVEFPDLVTTITDPVKLSSAVTSYFDARMFEDGSGEEYVSITLTDSDHFGTSGKFTFTNSGANAGWVISMKIFATPAVVTQDVYVREADETSVLNYGERILEIENDFFGDSDNTQSKALMTLRSLSEVGEVREMEIKGDMSLSLEDVVQVHLFGVDKNYRIIKIINGIGVGGGYKQIIRLSKEIDDESYFMVESSAIWGTDMIAP